MQKEKLVTANASGMLAILCSIFLILTGVLFAGFGSTFTKDLAPLFSGALGVLAGILCIIFAIFELIGAYLVYNFRYISGGIVILIASLTSTLVGGGLYISTLWGIGAGVIALICPSLEAKILESEG